MTAAHLFKESNAIPDDIAQELKAYDPLMARLLYNRGIVTKDEADAFLSPDYNTHLHDPFLFPDMEKAVERILRAIKEKEHIVVYTDYDCDGIPGGVLLHDFLTEIGVSHFENYIPHRHHEGYGFNVEAGESLAKKGAKLIVTVDCGIVDHAAVDAAQAVGADVIVTDHHEPSETLPAAYAVINPKRKDNTYPFDGLCGTGVAYKLVQALIARGVPEGIFELKEGFEKWWLDVVGIATIADMVPLTGENRVLAHYGLHVLRKSRRPGLQHLLRAAGGSQKHLTEEDIGFTIGPRINAASRMDNPEDAFHMLRTRDEAEAGERARHLEKLNNERKGVVAAMTKEAKKRLTKLETIPQVIVLGNTQWRPSLVGLVAQALVEEYKRPAFIWGRDGKGVIKGSCRSDGACSTLQLMEATPISFLGFGGHQVSGGFSVDDTKIHALQDALCDAYVSLDGAPMTQEELVIDADLELREVDNRLAATLKKLSPFGMGNTKPVFRFRDVAPSKVEVFGKTKNHTKLIFETENGRREAIAFFTLPEQFTTKPEEGKTLSLIAHVEESFFMGRNQIRLRVIDIA